LVLTRPTTAEAAPATGGATVETSAVRAIATATGMATGVATGMATGLGKMRIPAPIPNAP
jgi:hypothetical protein